MWAIQSRDRTNSPLREDRWPLAKGGVNFKFIIRTIRSAFLPFVENETTDLTF